MHKDELPRHTPPLAKHSRLARRADAEKRIAEARHAKAVLRVRVRRRPPRAADFDTPEGDALVASYI